MLDLFNTRFFRVYIIPGAVFQSVMIGGGYGTGREIVEYFTAYGLVGGLLGLLVAFLSLGITLALTFELARVFNSRDYRGFFKLLLGRGWIAFEVLIVLLFMLVLAVLASASGNILNQNFGIPYYAGLGIMLIVVGILTFHGRELIARVLTFWSFVLYAVFIAFLIAVFTSEWASVERGLQNTEILSGWWQSGLQYALYNVSAAPLLLYVARDFEKRSEALRSGMLAGAIAIVPAVILHVAFFGFYPAVLDEPVPVYWVMAELGASVLVLVYSVMLFGTFIETGAGMLQGINDRIDAYMVEKRGRVLSRQAHAGLAVFATLLSSVLAFWGIVNLIAQGYGTMAWGFLAVYVVPLLTVGAWRIFAANSSAGAMPVAAARSAKDDLTP